MIANCLYLVVTTTLWKAIKSMLARCYLDNRNLQKDLIDTANFMFVSDFALRFFSSSYFSEAYLQSLFLAVIL